MLQSCFVFMQRFQTKKKDNSTHTLFFSSPSSLPFLHDAERTVNPKWNVNYVRALYMYFLVMVCMLPVYFTGVSA